MISTHFHRQLQRCVNKSLITNGVLKKNQRFALLRGSRFSSIHSDFRDSNTASFHCSIDGGNFKGRIIYLIDSQTCPRDIFSSSRNILYIYAYSTRTHTYAQVHNTHAYIYVHILYTNCGGGILLAVTVVVVNTNTNTYKRAHTESR